MGRKRQSKTQIEAGKYYQNLKTKGKVIGGIKDGKWRGFIINEQSRKERKMTFQIMLEKWFKW